MMAQYLAFACSLIAQFTRFEVAQVPRLENTMGEDLENIASKASYPCHAKLNVLPHSSIFEEAVLSLKLELMIHG